MCPAFFIFYRSFILPVEAVFVSGAGRGYAERVEGTQASGSRVRRKGIGYAKTGIGYAEKVEGTWKR